MIFSALRTASCFTLLGNSLGIGVRYCNGLNMAGICFDVALVASSCSSFSVLNWLLKHLLITTDRKC